MNVDVILGSAAAAISAAILTYLALRAVLRLDRSVNDGAARPAAGGSLRAMLSVPAAFVLRRRSRDRELDRKLSEYEKLIAQSGGRFLEGAGAAEVFVARYVFPALAIVFFIAVGAILRISPGLVMCLSLLFGIMLYCWPESALKDAAKKRTGEFVHELPVALDVMRLVTQAGGDLNAAIESVITVTPKGPVREELIRCQGEVTIGASLAEALSNIAGRIDVAEANAVFSTLAQSIEMGTSASDNLGSASELIRHSARVKAQTKAQKAVVAMSFPLLVLILPGIFIVLFAPLIIQFMNK